MNIAVAENIVALNWELKNQKKVKNENIIPLTEKLEYWFEKYPKGFAKHSEPRLDQMHLDGLSWTEELSISKYLFKKAFKEIGVCYLSPEQFEHTVDKFQGRFYCSVLHPLNNQRTFYYRNHKLIAAVSKKWFDGIELMLSLSTQNAGHNQ
ncbi:MAG TPA: hypothetical protein VF556_01890 [Pyrinomonadaceae bacterium]|jgi:hypothetical protein